MSEQKNLPVPAWFNPEQHLADYLDGKETDEIASSLGIKKSKLVYYFATRTPEEWKSVQLARYLRRYEEGEKELDGAQDMLAVNKAQAKIRSAQWILERVHRNVYGDVKQEERKEPVIVNISLGRDRAWPSAEVEGEVIGRESSMRLPNEEK